MATTQHKETDKHLHSAQKKAEQAGEHASDAVKETGNAAVSAADKAAENTGNGLKSAADTVRNNTPKDGVLGAASSTVADTLEKTGEYLEKEGASGAAKDLHQLIQNYPVTAVMAGLAVGYLIGCATSSRS
jgi:ElaB/YqjD/DUF883 family membrane-anchored ribosome-binding protein